MRAGLRLLASTAAVLLLTAGQTASGFLHSGVDTALAATADLDVLTSAAVAPVVSSFKEFPLAPSSAPEGMTAGPDGNVWFVENAASKIGRITPSGVLTEFALAAFSAPACITAGPDGNLWFGMTGKIGRITPGGTITLFPIAGGGFPTRITSGPDGNLWFTENFRGNIGKIATRSPNTITQYPIPTRPGGGSSNPVGIAAGPDGNLWFTESNAGASKIGVVSTGGHFLHEYATPTPGSKPLGITAGPDGNLWFTESATTANRIGRVTPTGVFTEFRVPTPNAIPQGIQAGSDGNLWFTESNSSVSAIGAITPAGTVTEFAAPTTISSPFGIALGTDGNVWFSERAKSSIGRASISRTSTSYVLDLPAGFSPATRVRSIGGTVVWTFLGATAATVSDSSGMGLFDSGRHLPGTVYSVRFTSAGRYVYRDSLGARTGAVSVPMTASATSGTSASSFSLKWAAGAPQAGMVYDVQIKRPGSTTFVDWQHGVTANSAAFIANAGPGTYTFQARLRQTASGAASGYSAPLVLTVV